MTPLRVTYKSTNVVKNHYKKEVIGHSLATGYKSPHYGPYSTVLTANAIISAKCTTGEASEIMLALGRNKQKAL